LTSGVLLLLLFHSYGDHRDLHSFPHDALPISGRKAPEGERGMVPRPATETFCPPGGATRCRPEPGMGGVRKAPLRVRTGFRPGLGGAGVGADSSTMSASAKMVSSSSGAGGAGAAGGGVCTASGSTVACA